jgi:hypothetical protein
MSCALIDTWGLACLCGRLRRADELMKLGPFRKSFKEAGLTNIKKWRAKLSSLDRLFACCDVGLLVAPAVAPPLLLLRFCFYYASTAPPLLLLRFCFYYASTAPPLLLPHPMRLVTL